MVCVWDGTGERDGMTGWDGITGGMVCVWAGWRARNGMAGWDGVMHVSNCADSTANPQSRPPADANPATPLR